MKEIYGIVSCDVIDSTSLERDALIQLRNDIHSGLFHDLDALCPGFWIGIGSMRLIDREVDIMDGAAIYLAGRNLDFITDRGYTSYFEMDSENSEVNSLIDNNVMLVDRIVGQATERQVPILYDRLKGKTEVEIARSLSISQGAVNQRAMNAGWPFIKHTLTLLEDIDYKGYVE